MLYCARFVAIMNYGERLFLSERLSRALSSQSLAFLGPPEFAGFDALGQLEYYAGVTALLHDWSADRGGPPVVLHYFDNLPTASVATRAGRLHHYLAKRCARGEIRPGDAIALVGHSTGGLDIRRLLIDLDADARR